MTIATALLALIPVALEAEGGIEQLIALTATLHAAGSLTDDEVGQIRSDAKVADSEYDAALAAAKQRLA